MSIWVLANHSVFLHYFNFLRMSLANWRWYHTIFLNRDLANSTDIAPWCFSKLSSRPPQLHHGIVLKIFLHCQETQGHLKWSGQSQTHAQPQNCPTPASAAPALQHKTFINKQTCHQEPASVNSARVSTSPESKKELMWRGRMFSVFNLNSKSKQKWIHWLNTLNVIEKSHLPAFCWIQAIWWSSTNIDGKTSRPILSSVQATMTEVNEQSKSKSKAEKNNVKTCLAKMSHIFTQQANALNIRSSFRMLANNLKSKTWTVSLGNGIIFACPQSCVDVFHPNCFLLVVQILGTVTVLRWQLFLETALCDLKLFQHFLGLWVHWFQAETINLLNHFLAMSKWLLWKTNNMKCKTQLL